VLCLLQRAGANVVKEWATCEPTQVQRHMAAWKPVPLEDRDGHAGPGYGDTVKQESAPSLGTYDGFGSL
jgi:hypothetical protein